MGPGPTDSGVPPSTPIEAPRRVVNTGFATTAEPAAAIDASLSLTCGHRYHFWLEVGPPAAGSIEETPVPLPAEFPAESVLTVALFAFPGELEITPVADTGELVLDAAGSVTVRRQPADVEGVPPEAWLLQHRLFFPVRIPTRAGTYRARCGIYHAGLLVQSRVVSVRAARTFQRSARALRSKLD